MVKINYMNSTYYKIATCNLKRKESLSIYLSILLL